MRVVSDILRKDWSIEIWCAKYGDEVVGALIPKRHIDDIRSIFTDGDIEVAKVFRTEFLNILPWFPVCMADTYTNVIRKLEGTVVRYYACPYYTQIVDRVCEDIKEGGSNGAGAFKEWIHNHSFLGDPERWHHLMTMYKCNHCNKAVRIDIKEDGEDREVWCKECNTRIR